MVRRDSGKTKFEVDISLIYCDELLSNAVKEKILEDLLKENKVKFEKYYCSPDDRKTRLKVGRSITTKDKTIIYTFSCTEDMYDFIQYLLKKRLREISQLNSTYLS